MSLALDWVRNAENRWPTLSAIDLKDPQLQEAEGVYIIFHGGMNPGIVSVGQGKIGDQVKAESQDKGVLEFEKFKLYIAWAQTGKEERPGIEKYLSEKLSPKVSRPSLEAEAIPVNLPWRKNKQ